MASERIKMAQEILSAPEDKRDFEVKLDMFVSNMEKHFSTKRDLVKILHRELDNKNPKAVKIFQENMLPMAEALFEFLDKAHKKKIIRKELNPRFLTMDFFGLLTHHLRNEVVVDLFLKKNEGTSSAQYFHEESGRRILELFLKGVLV
jgi:hypothetical protein